MTGLTSATRSTAPLPSHSIPLVGFCLLAGCTGRFDLVNPSVGQIAFEANPPIGHCVAVCARPGSILSPQICSAVCKDETGHLIYLSPSTPGAGAVLSNMAGPFSDIIGRLAPVVPVVP
jgi:hypothetical protein